MDIPDSLLPHLLRAIVILAFALLAGLVVFVRGCSTRTRWIFLWSTLAAVGLVVIYGVARDQLGKRYVDRWDEHVAAMEAFVAERGAEIGLLSRRIDRLRALVQTDDWLPESESASAGTCTANHLVWAHWLRGEHGELDSTAPFVLDDVATLQAWVDRPETIPDTYEGQLTVEFEPLLAWAATTHILVAQIESLRMPEVTELEFGPKGEISVQIAPGHVAFGLAVVEAATGQVVAFGRGEAVSSEHVEIRGALGFLASDLRRRTEQEIQALARRLCGAP